MRICIVNQSKIPDAEVQTAIMAIDAQMTSLLKHWSIVAHLRLEGSRYLRKQSLKELQGDGLLYISDAKGDDALGWHDVDDYGRPWGVVYTGWDDEPWSVTLSHEVLELAADPHCNRLAAGPHPTEDRTVFYWQELCDAVQADYYSILGVEVSDFVLPAYFTPAEERGMRMSFQGAKVDSFGVAPGGYVGYFDPQTQTHETFTCDAAGQAAAKRKQRGRAACYKKAAK